MVSPLPHNLSLCLLSPLTTGSVDPFSLAVTLSSSVPYASDDSYSIYTDIVGLSSSTYLLLYFDSAVNPSTSPAGGSGPLSVRLATLSDLPDGVTLSIGAVTVLQSSALSLSFAASRLDNFTAVVAYADGEANYGIKVQLVRLIAEANGTSIGISFLHYPIDCFRLMSVCPCAR